MLQANIIIVASGKKHGNGSKESYTVEGPLNNMSAIIHDTLVTVYKLWGMSADSLKMVMTLQIAVIIPVSEAH